MDVGTAFVADGEAAEAADPGQRALDHPAVPAQALAILDAPPGDARGDIALAAFAPAAPAIAIEAGLMLRSLMRLLGLGMPVTRKVA